MLSRQCMSTIVKRGRAVRVGRPIAERSRPRAVAEIQILRPTFAGADYTRQATKWRAPPHPLIPAKLASALGKTRAVALAALGA